MKKWFEQLLSSEEGISPQDVISLEKACAVLMVEILASDNQIERSETAAVKAMLCKNYHLSQPEADSLVDEVMAQQKASTDLFRFTSTINEACSEPQKFALVKQLWHVAYADGDLDKHEEHMIRRLSDLIHLPHRLFIRAKIEAREDA